MIMDINYNDQIKNYGDEIYNEKMFKLSQEFSDAFCLDI